MGSIIFTGRKSITETAKAVTWVADADDMVLGATGRVQHKGDQGVDLLIGQVPPKETPRDTAEVEAIRINTTNTPLAKGCDHKNNGALRDGMLLEEKYELEVVRFKNGKAPASDNDIRWAFRYENEDGVQQGEFPGRGRKVLLNISEVPDICGRGLTLYAYINDKTKEGVLNTWVHYRFRWIPRERIKQQITDRRNAPYLINQKGTSLCGMACIFYLFAKNDKPGYEQYILELHQKGEATYKSYTAKPDKELWERQANQLSLDYADYVSMAVTRNNENRDYKGGNEQFSAVNWPWMMTSLCEKLLGYKEVTSSGIYNPIRSLVYLDVSIIAKINKINEYKAKGYDIILMIDSDLIDDRWDKESMDYHWVVLESAISVDYQPGLFGNKKDEIDFNVYTWGTDPNAPGKYLKQKIKLSHFASNYYGYIALK